MRPIAPSIDPHQAHRDEAALQAWFDSWRGTHYDPATGTIVFAGKPPAYAIRHEEAHRQQHRRRTLLWRLWTWRLPLVHRGIHLLLEIDADRRALRQLELYGELDPRQLLASRLSMEAAWDTFWGFDNRPSAIDNRQ